jgi:DNA-binding transcriptional regulator YhcF (GntR family)
VFAQVWVLALPRVARLRGGRERCYGTSVRSTKPTVEIDHSSPVPLHEQVAAAIRRAITEGEARSGERLPPARDLAAVLGVNANTVFRALRTLRDEGLVEFRRGRGVSVTAIAPQRSPVVAKAHELVAVGRQYGYRPEDLAAIIDQVS